MRPPGYELVGPRSIRWAIVAQFADRALRNHGQTLERLKERGGLAPTELLAVLTDQPAPSCSNPEREQEALDAIAEILNSYR